MTSRYCGSASGIIAENPAVRRLVLTTFDLDEYAFGALRAGASGFLLKDTPPGDLLAAIRVVATGGCAALSQYHQAADR
jgi:DNA-binding NarL/FixJ family response regulator